MINLILFGPPGCGKGTQSEKLINKYNLVHLSTGDILRAEIKKETTLGKEAKQLIDQGLLVPDEVVIGMIESKIDDNIDNAAGFIFDGFPRTITQAGALDKMLENKKTAITRVLSLEVGEEELTQRILNRGKSSGRSDDNDESIIKKRVIEYFEKTAPVAEYYAQQGKLSKINGVGSIDEIFDALCKEVNN